MQPSDYQLVPSPSPSDLLDLQIGGIGFQLGDVGHGVAMEEKTADEELGERLMSQWNQQPGGDESTTSTRTISHAESAGGDDGSTACSAGLGYLGRDGGG